MKSIERLRLEALVFAHDTMEFALEHLRQTALGLDPLAPAEKDRIALFSDCWTIVDQVHVVRQVLISLTGAHPGPDTRAYLDTFEVAHFLRNRMDHLNTNLPNRARQRGALTPLFGVVSYFRPVAEDFERGIQAGEVFGDMIVVTAGSTPSDAVGAVPFANLNVRLPVSGLRLEAFGRSLIVDDAVEQLKPLLRRLSDDTNAQVLANVEELSRRSSLPVEDLLRSTGGYFAMTARMSIVIEIQ
jgi:hypothetical protein